jgi:hypothetical protein
VPNNTHPLTYPQHAQQNIQQVTVVEEVHKGLKTFKMTFLANHQQYVSVGFNRQARRELKTFDSRTNKVLKEQTLDQSSGLLFPFYDEVRLSCTGGAG